MPTVSVLFVGSRYYRSRAFGTTTAGITNRRRTTGSLPLSRPSLLLTPGVFGTPGPASLRFAARFSCPLCYATYTLFQQPPSRATLVLYKPNAANATSLVGNSALSLSLFHSHARLVICCQIPELDWLSAPPTR